MTNSWYVASGSGYCCTRGCHLGTTRRAVSRPTTLLTALVCELLLGLLMFIRPAAGGGSAFTNTTSLLNDLLSEENYNRQIRPDFGGPPTVILTDLLIRSFGPISEKDMIYSMDCYFRQSWYDRRLQFQSDIKLLAVSWQFLERVWTPDTYFFNGRESYLHKVTVPNKFVRLGHDGHLMYSMRLTIKASCIMHLRKYPLDSQACPLEIGSFAYSSKEVVFKWKGVKAVDISNDVTLSQYEILKITTANVTSYGPAGEVRSSLMARFILRRRRGYFILQIYAPCSMIVGASWVAFWINRNDAAGRVAVGATTVLTLVTMGFGGRAALPGVNYATALDWFIIMCFTFVFTALVEYACVNYIERFLQHRERARLAKLANKEQIQDTSKDLKDSDPQNTGGENVRLRLEATEEEQHRSRSKVYGFWEQIFGCRWPRRRRPQYRTCKTNKDGMTPSEVSAEVDAWARIIFPVTFTVLKIMYWTMFLYFIDDEIPTDPPTHP